MRTGVLIFFLTLIVTSLFAGDIDKAYKYLNTGDYPNAYKYLREALTDEPDNAAVNYGLAKYFSSKDNSQYNLDSAIIYVNQAAKKLPFNPDDKVTKKLLSLGVRDYTIQTLQKSINFEAYSVANQANSLESYQHYIDHFNDKGYVDQATQYRNQKAYVRALSLKTSAALDEFMRKYPDAVEVKEAKERYEKLVYEQTTADGSFESYRKYLVTYPTGFYTDTAKILFNEKVFEHYAKQNDLAAYLEFERTYKNHPRYRDIQDSIYKLATKDGTVEAYKNFINNYSQNHNKGDAWENLYLLYTAEGRETDYQAYVQEFANAPNKNKAISDMGLVSRNLKPFQGSDRWGYAILPAGDTVNIPIPVQFLEALEFSNGLAAVRTKPCTPLCSYFYIDKAGVKAIDKEFNFAGNFEHGYAVVGVGNCEEDSCLYGLIDKRGVYVIPPIYEEIDDPSEDYYLVSKNGKVGYLNKKGEEMISLKYTDGLPFKQGLAGVGIDGNWFFIDKTGKQAFINRFHDVSSFSDSLCAVTQDGENWGYIDMGGNFVIEPVFESAEDFENGFAIISKKEKDPKNKALTISQRYKIDKHGKIIEKLTAPKETSRKPTRKKGGRK